MINLRSISEPGKNQESIQDVSRGTLSDLRFSNGFIGNMGGSLAYGAEHEDEEVEFEGIASDVLPDAEHASVSFGN